MEITMTTKAEKPKPKAGDRKMIKGVEHIRCRLRVKYLGRWMYDFSGGRQRFVWKPVSEVQDKIAPVWPEDQQ